MTTQPPRAWLRWALIGVACGLHAASASAQPDLRSVRRDVSDVEAAATQLAVDPLRHEDLRSATYVEERLTDGELFYRLQDYERAAIILTDIVVNYPEHPAANDALFLLGESLYRAGDYIGARSRMRRIIGRAGEPGFAKYVPQALGRLIEIAVHTRDFEGVESYFDQLSRLPPSQLDAATNYYRAKFLYNRAVAAEDLLREGLGSLEGHVDMAELEQARQAFEAVVSDSPYYAQARYFVGVILTLQGRYPGAIDTFNRLVRAPAESPEAKRVRELAQLGLGRLYYETQQLDHAVDAYQNISRNSVLFDVALYEIAWVYIRMGDSTRAERALEVLMVAVPDSRYQADSLILRGNLLLREGRLIDAREVFSQAIANYRPIREELDAMIAAHDDPVTYFRELVRQNIDTFDASTIVPPEALKYAEEEADIDRALSALSDLNQARTMVRDTSDIIQRLDAALSADSRVNAFADLRRQRQRTTSLRNRVARLRTALIAIESRQLPAEDAELLAVRKRRRQLERALFDMPTEAEHFVERDDEMLDSFRKLGQELRNLEVELMGLEARIAATEHFVKDTQEVRQNAEGIEAVMDELATQRAAVATYRETLHEHELALEAGQAQVGVGDARYKRDDDLRDEYNGLVAQERELLAARGVRSDPEVESLYRRLAGVEDALQLRDEQIGTVVDERTARMLQILEEESVNVEGYRERLAELEREAEDVIGGIAYNSFAAVRNRFYELVLEADVGQIDVAWAEREEHRMRVEQLSRERARELKALDDEFREIMDQNGADQ